MIVGAIAVALCVLLAVAVLALGRSLQHTQRTLADVTTTVASLREDVVKLAAPPEEDDAQPVEALPPYGSLARPVIKARALSAGTTSAARLLRDRLANGKH